MKINIGSGPHRLPGYVNVDRKDGGEAFPLRANDGQSITDGVAEEVRASHVLEHFGHQTVEAVVREWARVLKPGGILKIAVPDFDAILKACAAGNPDNWPLIGYIYGGQTDDDDYHKVAFNEAELAGLFEACGLVFEGRWESDAPDCSSLPVSMNLQARKPAVAIRLPGVHAVLSMPRYAFTQQVACLLETTYRLRIPTLIRQGVFWGATLTTAIKTALDNGAEFILTIDIDTVWRTDHVVELHRLLAATPNAMAVCGTQIGRDRDTPLLTVRKSDNTGNDGQLKREAFEVPLLKVNTGHFGLTLIRAEVFAKLPKPWFKAIPNADGEWNDGRIDEDIYFWKQMEACGLPLYQANNVRLGHWQDVVTLPTDDLEPVHVYSPDFRAGKIPANVKW